MRNIASDPLTSLFVWLYHAQRNNCFGLAWQKAEHGPRTMPHDTTNTICRSPPTKNTPPANNTNASRTLTPRRTYSLTHKHTRRHALSHTTPRSRTYGLTVTRATLLFPGDDPPGVNDAALRPRPGDGSRPRGAGRGRCHANGYPTADIEREGTAPVGCNSMGDKGQGRAQQRGRRLGSDGGSRAMEKA